jgi:hypothetical protein
MLQAILRLRICCNNGTYARVPTDDTEENLDPDEALTLLEESDEAICAICTGKVELINQFENPDSGVFGTCWDVLCATCFESKVREGERSQPFTCPVCKQQVHPQILPFQSGVKRDGLCQPSGRSTKLQRLVEDLKEHQHIEKR